MSGLPGGDGENRRENEQQRQTDQAENRADARFVEQHTGAGCDRQRPQKIAGAGAESDTPSPPEPATLFARKQAATDHLSVDRPRRPGHRPVEHESVN